MFLESQLPIIGKPRTEGDPIVEVCRSYSYRLNLGKYGRQYEHLDFFASRKIACTKSTSSWVSEDIYEECKAEVRAAVQEWLDLYNSRKRAAAIAVADVQEGAA